MSAVVFRDRPEVKHHLDEFTDIWLAGVSDETFRRSRDHCYSNKPNHEWKRDN
jgi:hypothetical protein